MARPSWLTELQTHLDARFDEIERRTSSLEKAVMGKAALEGAKAARRWASVITVVLSVLVSMATAQCTEPPIPDSPSESP